MSSVKTFTIGGESYNVARATAVQQDEALSILTAPLVERMAKYGADKSQPVDEDLIFAMSMAMPYSLKKILDGLLLTRVTRSGEQNPITIRDFDGRIMDYNRLRAQVLIWNFEDFFTYWANERSAEALASQPPSETV